MGLQVGLQPSAMGLGLRWAGEDLGSVYFAQSSASFPALQFSASSMFLGQVRVAAVGSKVTSLREVVGCVRVSCEAATAAGGATATGIVLFVGLRSCRFQFFPGQVGSSLSLPSCYVHTNKHTHAHTHAYMQTRIRT